MQQRKPLNCSAPLPSAHHRSSLPWQHDGGIPWGHANSTNMADVHHHERILCECSPSEVPAALGRAVQWSRSLHDAQGGRTRLLLCRTALRRDDKLELTLDHLVDLFGRGSGELFEALVTCLKSCSTANVVTCLELLAQFVNTGELTQLMLKQTSVGDSQSKEAIVLPPQQQQTLQFIAKLPDLAANRIHGLDPFFSPRVYFTHVMECVMDVLEAGGAGGGRAKGPLLFVAHLMGKLVTIGQAGGVVSQYMAAIKSGLSGKKAASWKELSLELCYQLPDSAVDQFVTHLLLSSPPSLSGDCVLWGVMGKAGLERPSVRHSLLHRNLFMRWYKEPNVLYNIAGYLLCWEGGLEELVQTLDQVVRVWCDRSALLHTPLPQHLYISEALVLFATCAVERSGGRLSRRALLSQLLEGVGNHLDSTTPALRSIGQLVAEGVVTKLDEHGTQLKFEVDTDSLCEGDVKLHHLKSLSEPLEDQKRRLQSTTVLPTSLSSKGEVFVPQQDVFQGPVTVVETSDSDDDDLEPYALPEEKETAGPRYLRQCIHDLVQTEDVEKFQCALRRVEGLVRRNPLELQEVAMELTKVLLYLSDSYDSEGFDEQRMGAMVAIATRCPKEVAGYLTKEVYGDNHSVRQRLEALEVLTMASQELSRVQPGTSPHPQPPSLLTEKLEGQTRRFPSARPVEGNPNRFAPVVGYFFYPLLNGFDSAPSHVKEDALIVSKLLYTLALFAFAAKQLPMAESLAGNLVDFALQFKGHPDRKVKEGVVLACQASLSSLPKHALMDEARPHMEKACQLLADETYLQ